MEQSILGATQTVHLRDCQVRVSAHAWNEPGQKHGKPSKYAAELWIANCFSGVQVELWWKERTY